MSHGSYSRRELLRLAAAGAGVTTLGPLAACAPSAPQGDSGGGGKGDFSFASWSLADDLSKEVIQSMMKDFGKEHGVEVKGKPFGYPDYLNQLTLQVRGGQFSGAAQLDIAWLSAIAGLQKLRDLGPEAKGVDYTDSALPSGQLDGVQYGLPWTTAGIGLVTNRELLGKAGISKFPTAIDDFEAALTELKGTDVIPYAAMTKVAQLKDIQMWMQTFGCPMLTDGKVAVGDDASIEAVAWYKKLYDKGLIAKDVERTDARTLFSQGKTAMYDDAIVAKSIVVSESPDKDFASKLEPVSRPVLSAGDPPQAQLWGHIVVVVDGDGEDTAAKFARWVTSDQDTVLKYFKELAVPPATKSALQSDVVQADEFTTAFTERITATAEPYKFWQFPQYARMTAALAEQVQAVLVGRASPAKAMKAAGEKMQRLAE